MKRYFLPTGEEMVNVHSEDDCAGQRACIIHRPTDHRMSDWPLHWRNDRGIFERICEHSIGHPDPDQFDFWLETGQPAQAVHGCDGCCFDDTMDATKEEDSLD